MSQLQLLFRRRFWSLFWTQFLGAFNDNLFKNALVIIVAYRSLELAGLTSEKLVVACAGIFIMPFFLFSATAGQLADRFSKAIMIRWIKGAEIVIMALAGVGFALSSLPLLMVVLFLMGLQSAFFGPSKYSILPELLDDKELVGGNALVETGTFLAILLGTITGGWFVSKGDAWISWLGAVVVTIAVSGLVASFLIPRTRAANPDLAVSVNPVAPTVRILRVTTSNRVVFLSILGISWFWFIGASFLSLLPNFSKDVLRGGEPVVTLFLAVFCIGIAVGSLLCERLSNRRLELGLVPLGSIGISLFALDLALASGPFAAALADRGALMGIWEFLGAQGGVRICCDLLLIAIFSGFYTVPLYTLVQQRSDAEVRSRVIAGNNIINAMFIVVSSLTLVYFLGAGLTIPLIFAVMAVMNLVVALYIYTVIPEFLLRFAAWVLAKIMYRLKAEGEEEIPDEGPVILVANHVSWVDWLVIASLLPARPPRFVMDHRLGQMPVISYFFRDAKVIPIAADEDSPEVLDNAYAEITTALDRGEVVCLFPEGRITPDGKLGHFIPEIVETVRKSAAPVLPVALIGLWGSFFSRRWGAPMTRPFRRFWSRVTVRIGKPVPPEEITAQGLAEQVAKLGGWQAPAVESEIES
jgi:1-acyl-sn-glycerol-3-phosphate acyltransferase